MNKASLTCVSTLAQVSVLLDLYDIPSTKNVNYT